MVIVYLKENGKAAVSDSTGKFEIQAICVGTYTLSCQYTGYLDPLSTIYLDRNKQYDISLQEDTIVTKEIVIMGMKAESPPLLQSMSTLSGKELDQTRGLTLGESLKALPGVYTLQTGPSIFKPVIHGMHSNRVLIMNNGIRQEGQQWGAEHAPEIDPFIANQLTVIKGPASIRYGSDAIAGVILVDPAPLLSKSGISGEVNLIGASNNRMGVGSGILQGAHGKKKGILGWRLQGTYRRAGNAKTPGYYMENTGLEEKNFSATVGYKTPRFGLEVFYSQFNTQLGIFTGASAETIQDLEAAIQRPEPLTPSYFSYTINRPYQVVKHQLLKASGYVRFRNASKLEMVLARQSNERSEYDYVSLSGRSSPDLYLHLTTHTVDLSYAHSLSHQMEGRIGISGITQGNVRQFQMLIPNFRNYGGGIFLMEKWTKNKWAWEAGLRYDYKWLRAYMLDNVTGHVITPTFSWQNVTGSLGVSYQISPWLKWLSHVSNAWRAPTVNELLSDGVHQSAVSYEIGNPTLQTERSYNINSELNYQGKRFKGSVEVYYNYMQGYIFLKPDLHYVHTARGAFPSFTYTQVDAIFKGLDLSASYDLIDSLRFSSKTSLLFAYNVTLHDYLQLVPANRFENGFTYGWGNIGRLNHVYLGANSVYVAKQERVPVNSDYAPPPSGYMLLQADLGLTFTWGKQQIQVSLSGTNLLNTRYRDYLDRFRYFTDEPGRNIILRIKTSF
jgi:iron complex outermembrane receptor protein